jgi:pyruvate formate lyase activating enzyme
VVTDHAVCTLCGACAAACPALATEISGRPMAVEEILAVIEKERPFFDQSAGGVTFSGGEPLLYPDFLIELLDRCGARGIHRAIDTSGYVKTATLLEVARHADLFLYDLKLIDTDRHRRYTGVDNSLILNNLEALAATGVAIQVRVPLLGGVNDDAENLAGIADFVAGLAGSRKAVNLLPYHDVARGKDAKLRQHRDLHAIHEPGPEGLERAIRVFGEHGLRATVGG